MAGLDPAIHLPGETDPRIKFAGDVP